MEIEERLARIEARLDALEQQPAAEPAGELPDAFFALAALRERVGPPGGVVFAGAVTLPGSSPVEWQFGRATEQVLAGDWAARASTLAALAHPVRLTLLREIVHGRDMVAALAELDGLGTTGQIYHHLRQLTAEGWLHTRARGQYAVPAERVVPLLTVLTAVER
jgi:DNA-binding transcriptional ArsR family regulator